MDTSDPRNGDFAKGVQFENDSLRVDLIDGRSMIVPLSWYPRLLNATPQQRANWQLIGRGFGIHWPDVDEDISVEGMLRGFAAPEGQPRIGS